MLFDCLIVLYNCRCEESRSVSSLINHTETSLSLHVYDNSTDETICLENLQYCKKNSLQYTGMHGNAGLAKVYNLGMSHVEPGGWAILFDQDTTAGGNFIQSLEKSILTHPDIGIHVPVVQSGDGRIMSPSLIKGHRILRLKSAAPGVYTGITAINAGMAIKKSIFDRVGPYNEEIFLDYLDHQFIRAYKETDKRMAVFDSVLRQEFSDTDHSNFQTDLSRFIIYKHDFHVFCKDSFSGIIFYYLKIVFRAWKLARLHKRTEFLKVALRGRGALREGNGL